MLLDAVVIVLRESLEAGIVISLLMSVSTRSGSGPHWFWSGLIAGVSGAALYAWNLGAVSGWFQGVGQEVLNAGLQYMIYLLVLAVVIMICRPTDRSLHLPGLMAAVVALAIAREGAEIIVFYYGYLHTEHILPKALTSGFIGLMIGMSVGALCYYLLLSLAEAAILPVQVCLLTLVAAGMVAQGSQLLIQADWLPAAMPLWDSNWILPEHTVAGQVAYATFGYEATPTPLEVIVYLGAIALAPLLLWTSRRLRLQVSARATMP